MGGGPRGDLLVVVARAGASLALVDPGRCTVVATGLARPETTAAPSVTAAPTVAAATATAAVFPWSEATVHRASGRTTVPPTAAVGPARTSAPIGAAATAVSATSPAVSAGR